MNQARQMKQIEKLRTKDLKAKLTELTGKATKSNNRPYLLKQIAKALEEQTAARVPTKKKPKAQSETKKNGRDPRLPAPGTILERKHDGKKIRVKVLEDGFEYRGKTYRSLSGVAREATQQIWNGFLFFRLIPYAKRASKSEGRAS